MTFPWWCENDEKDPDWDCSVYTDDRKYRSTYIINNCIENGC